MYIYSTARCKKSKDQAHHLDNPEIEGGNRGKLCRISQGGGDNRNVLFHCIHVDNKFPFDCLERQGQFSFREIEQFDRQTIIKNEEVNHNGHQPYLTMSITNYM